MSVAASMYVWGLHVEPEVKLVLLALCETRGLATVCRMTGLPWTVVLDRVEQCVQLGLVRGGRGAYEVTQ